MTLTRQDLSAIDQIVTKRIKPVTDDVKILKQDVSGLKGDLKTVKKDVFSLKSDIKTIKTDLKTTINFFDKEHLGLKKRVEKTELKLGIPAPEF